MDSNAESVSITVAEIRAAGAVLFDLVEREFGSTVDLRADHYWTIGAREAFDLSQEPNNGAGQLSDDVQSVRALIDSDEPVLWHDIEHFVGVLRRLAVLALP